MLTTLEDYRTYARQLEVARSLDDYRTYARQLERSASTAKAAASRVIDIEATRIRTFKPSNPYLRFKSDIGHARFLNRAVPLKSSKVLRGGNIVANTLKGIKNSSWIYPVIGGAILAGGLVSFLDSRKHGRPNRELYNS